MASVPVCLPGVAIEALVIELADMMFFSLQIYSVPALGVLAATVTTVSVMAMTAYPLVA